MGIVSTKIYTFLWVLGSLSQFVRGSTSEKEAELDALQSVKSEFFFPSLLSIPNEALGVRYADQQRHHVENSPLGMRVTPPRQFPMDPSLERSLSGLTVENVMDPGKQERVMEDPDLGVAGGEVFEPLNPHASRDRDTKAVKETSHYKPAAPSKPDKGNVNKAGSFGGVGGPLKRGISVTRSVVEPPPLLEEVKTVGKSPSISPPITHNEKLFALDLMGILKGVWVPDKWRQFRHSRSGPRLWVDPLDSGEMLKFFDDQILDLNQSVRPRERQAAELFLSRAGSDLDGFESLHSSVQSAVGVVLLESLHALTALVNGSPVGLAHDLRLNWSEVVAGLERVDVAVYRESVALDLLLGAEEAFQAIRHLGGMKLFSDAKSLEELNLRRNQLVNPAGNVLFSDEALFLCRKIELEAGREAEGSSGGAVSSTA